METLGDFFFKFGNFIDETKPVSFFVICGFLLLIGILMRACIKQGYDAGFIEGMKYAVAEKALKEFKEDKEKEKQQGE